MAETEDNYASLDSSITLCEYSKLVIQSSYMNEQPVITIDPPFLKQMQRCTPTCFVKGFLVATEVNRVTIRGSVQIGSMHTICGFGHGLPHNETKQSFVVLITTSSCKATLPP